MSEKIKTIISLIRSRFGEDINPRIGIILGSGLGMLTSSMQIKARLKYSDIDGFPVSTVKGHAGEFVYGTLSGVEIIAMNGRVHFYEGYGMDQVVLPVRVMCGLGIQTMIVSNAAGGLNEKFVVGDIMIIEDHINLLPNPLIGPNDESMGVRFPAMSGAYSKKWRETVEWVARNTMGIELQKGVYIGSSGPTFETPAENRFFRTIGADATGMSTTPEVIVARHQGVEVMGLSLITNMNLGPNVEEASHEDVFKAASISTEKLSRLVELTIAKIYEAEQD